MKAKVTIARQGMSKGDGLISIEIGDRSSGLHVVGVTMSLQEFAEAITGLGFCEAEFSFTPTQYTVCNIGKTREIKSIFVDKPDTYGRVERKEKIAESIKESGELTNGWEVWSDGTTTQQNATRHEVILCRYV